MKNSLLKSVLKWKNYHICAYSVFAFKCVEHFKSQQEEDIEFFGKEYQRFAFTKAKRKPGKPLFISFPGVPRVIDATGFEPAASASRRRSGVLALVWRSMPQQPQTRLVTGLAALQKQEIQCLCGCVHERVCPNFATIFNPVAQYD